jgi:ABC-type multidrug transport system ATPase subunit
MQSSFDQKFHNTPLGDGGMQILLHNTGKRFNREWIFRHLSFTFQPGISYAITGPNGSGKSTLLQTIAGAISPSEGIVEYSRRQKAIITQNSELKTQNLKPETEIFYNSIAIVAPYLEVIEEMTATEFLQFHSSFKRLLSTISINEILDIVGLKQAGHKQIRFFSSGMKQRIKLVQGIFSDVPVLLLDEPCTNLDATGYDLYHRLIDDYCKNKLIIVSSNDVNEYDFCEKKISILDYK